MTKTEELVSGINSLFKLTGDEKLLMPKEGEWTSELELLRIVKKEYKRRLLEKMPQYKSIPPHLIPDMLLDAFNQREKELTARE